MENKVCPKCGNNIMPGQIFCSKCGANLTVSSKQEAPKDNKKRNKIIIGISAAVVAMIAIVVTLIIVFSQHDSGEDYGTRTMMIYMIGSNLESEDGLASKDIEEIKNLSLTRDVNVIIYAGGSNKWEDKSISNSSNAIYEVSGGRLTKKQEYSNLSMTDSSTLKTFLDYGHDNYNSDLYDLILWGHGGGPMYGYGSDENHSLSPLTLQDIDNAFSDSKFVKDNKKLEFIGFDAGLMGNIEVANILKKYSNYMIASEEAEPTYSWNYNFLDRIDMYTKTKEIGESIIDHYADQYGGYYYEINYSLSMIDLTEVDSLIKNTDALINVLNGKITATTFSSFSRKLTKEIVYGSKNTYDNFTYDLVDLHDLLASVSDQIPKEYKNFDSAYNAAVVYNKTNIKNTNGLSIYFPTINRKNSDQELNNYKKYSISKDYFTFLKNYTTLMTKNKLVTQNNFNHEVETLIDHAQIKAKIPSILAENYQYAEYIIWRKLSNNQFVPVFETRDIELDGDTLTMQNPGIQFAIAASSTENNPVRVIMHVEEKTDDYTIYYMYATIQEMQSDDSSNWKVENVKLSFKVNKNDTVGKLVDAVIYDRNDNSGLTSRNGINLENWDYIINNLSSYPLYDENGSLYEDWKKSSTNIGGNYQTKALNEIELRLVPLNYNFNDDAILDYYGQFRVYDTQGYVHNLDIEHL